MRSTQSKTLYAVVTFYHPEPEHFSNLKKLATAPGISGVVVVQNCETDLPAFDLANCIFIKNGNKGGIAGAFNRGVEEAFKEGADTIVLFDQDSKISEDFAIKMLSFMEKHQAKLAAPAIFDVNSQKGGSYFKLHRFSVERASQEEEAIRCNLVISSGCLISKTVFDSVGLFDEKLFIDLVDTDFNVRAYLKGFDVLVNPAVVLMHSIGKRSAHRLFGLMTIKPTHHLPFRRYFYARNSVYLAMRYVLKCPIVVWLIFLHNVHDTLGIIFYEDQKAAKFRAMLRGVWHALIGKMNA